MDFTKYFEKYKPKDKENLLPSVVIPLEIERWETYKKLVGQRSAKYLLMDKNLFISYLSGNTLPMSRAFEGHPLRSKFLNPLFDVKTNSFPKWEAIVYIVNMIGENKEGMTVKSGINAAIKDLVETLKQVDLVALNKKVLADEAKLSRKREAAVRSAISNKQLLSHYPQPEDLYYES